MKTLVIMAVLATVALAGGMEFGPQVGYWFPTGDAGDAFSGNFYIGAQFISHMPVIAFEASIGYHPLKLDGDLADALELVDTEYSGRLIPITAGIRSYSGTLYAAGGLELDMVSQSFEYADGTDSDDSDSEFGGYIGAGLITPIVGTGDVDINARLHFVDFDDMWVGIQGGINF